jgi:hypothetical protein
MSTYYGPYGYTSGNPEDAPHFLPRDMLLLVEHPDALNRHDLGQLLRRINSNGGTKLETPRYVMTCPPSKHRAPFSLVFTRIEERDPAPAALVPHLTRVNEMTGARRRGNRPSLQLASPNWLAGGAPPIIWGGPGSRPVPVEGYAIQEERCSFQLPSELKLQRPHEQRGEGVDVAILDTAPRKKALAQAYDRWHYNHSLSASLLWSGSRLAIRYDGNGSIPSKHYFLDNHAYRMPDHGLFAAGIIHSIAPQASLHLVETLNSWGVGDLERLMYVLYQFVNRPQRRPLVINCSLVLNLPQPTLLTQISQRGGKWAGIDEQLVQQMQTPLEWVCDVLREQHVIIVAAAGNDTLYTAYRTTPQEMQTGGYATQAAYAISADNTSNGAAQTRYPAAFDSVLGVGALGPDGEPASYSNRADDPSHKGVATFGGAAHKEYVLPEQGVLGIYTGEFPDGSPNTNGWAWWAGTSFAAPVISGTLAALLSENPDPDAALDAIKGVTAEAKSTAIGPTFPVRQG